MIILLKKIFIISIKTFAMTCPVDCNKALLFLLLQLLQRHWLWPRPILLLPKLGNRPRFAITLLGSAFGIAHYFLTITHLFIYLQSP